MISVYVKLLPHYICLERVCKSMKTVSIGSPSFETEMGPAKCSAGQPFTLHCLVTWYWNDYVEILLDYFLDLYCLYVFVSNNKRPFFIGWVLFQTLGMSQLCTIKDTATAWEYVIFNVQDIFKHMQIIWTSHQCFNHIVPLHTIL